MARLFMTQRLCQFEEATLHALINQTMTHRHQQYPNPCVGAMVILDNQTVSEGFHTQSGHPHAEVIALELAGNQATGATLLITLEPCCHTGKTTPCVDAIIASGIARVIWAIDDPNPLVTGKSKAILESHGIAVVDHVMPDLGRAIIKEFDAFHRLKRPYIYVKAAISLDGYIAPNRHQLHYISNQQTLDVVQAMRCHVQAICVGESTIRIDQPRLSIRTFPVNTQPMIVILDPHNRVDTQWLNRTLDTNRCIHVFRTKPLQICHSQLHVHDGLLENKTENWRYVFKTLYSLNVQGVLIEGGSGIFDSILGAQLFDELWITRVPDVFASKTAVPFIQQAKTPLNLQLTSTKALGNDVLTIYTNTHAVYL